MFIRDSIGRAFVERCKELLDCYDEMLEEMEHLKYGNDRPIDLGYLYGASSCLLYTSRCV